MSAKKLSEFPDFPSKPLLYAAQKRGLEVLGDVLDGRAADLMIVGLADILWEAYPEIRRFVSTSRDVGDTLMETKAAKPLPKPKKWWQW